MFIIASLLLSYLALGVKGNKGLVWKIRTFGMKVAYRTRSCCEVTERVLSITVPLIRVSVNRRGAHQKA